MTTNMSGPASRPGRTRCLCTIGPRTLDAESLRILTAEGMNIARVNGSHGSLDDIRRYVSFLRQHLPEGVGILLDLPGNKVRTDNIEKPIQLAEGDSFVLEPHNLTYPTLHARVRSGFRISAADGAIQLEVVEVSEGRIHTRVLVGGELANRKGINVRGIHESMPFDFERDMALMNIAIEHEVEYIGLSFVRAGEHVRRIKSQLVDTPIKVVAKVETAEAVACLDQILADADLIMVDRGDLEAEIGRENVPLTTKYILAQALEAGIPAIVASQFLTSMMDKPLPFMSEVSDIANAVLDRASILMLSEETAVGAYPFECMATMREVARTVESRMTGDHRAVILAAGPSTGFGSLTTNKHKSMLDVGGNTIINHLLENLGACGIPSDQVVVVTGHNHRQIETYLRGEGYRGQFVHNPWYQSTNMLISLWLARPQGPTIVLYGDIILDRSIVADLLATPGNAVLAIDGDSELGPEDEKVIIENGRITRLGKELDGAASAGEFLGIARFDGATTRRLCEAAEDVIKTGGMMDFLTVALEHLAAEGLELTPCWTEGRPWNDNDTLSDLDRSRESVFPRILEAQRRRDALRETVAR